MQHSVCTDCQKNCPVRPEVKALENQLQIQKNINKKLRAQVKKLTTVNQLELDFGAN